MANITTDQITVITDGSEYEVPSSDGSKTYTVKYCGCGDEPDMVRTWECSCPAGQHGRMCKHVRAVIELVDSADDY